MSLKTCLNCGKEFEGDQNTCPECTEKEQREGASVQEEEVTLDDRMEEAAADAVEETKEQLGTEEVKAEDSAPVMEASAPVTETKNDSTASKKKKTKLIIGIIAAIVIVAAVGVGIKVNMDKKAHEAYVKEYNNYLSAVKSVRSDMLNSGADAEGMINETLSVWYNAIWEKDDAKTNKFTKPGGVFVSDFNTALSAYLKDADTVMKEIELNKNRILVDGEMEKLEKVPEGLETHYTKISDLYEVYLDFVNLAMDPDGSYTTFRDKSSSLSTDFMTKYKRIDSLNFDQIK